METLPNQVQNSGGETLSPLHDFVHLVTAEKRELMHMYFIECCSCARGLERESRHVVRACVRACASACV